MRFIGVTRWQSAKILLAAVTLLGMSACASYRPVLLDELELFGWDAN